MRSFVPTGEDAGRNTLEGRSKSGQRPVQSPRSYGVALHRAVDPTGFYLENTFRCTYAASVLDSFHGGGDGCNK